MSASWRPGTEPLAHPAGGAVDPQVVPGPAGPLLGPLIANALADADAGITGPARYTTAFTIMIVLLVIGFVPNALIRPGAEKFHEPAAPTTTPTGAQV
ncbi:MAG: hypothetical protein QOG20_6187 [Pseudonocardiales bacterium]|nr:hypothetical protein [Pseudonocardiales bacterium]